MKIVSEHPEACYDHKRVALVEGLLGLLSEDGSEFQILADPVDGEKYYKDRFDGYWMPSGRGWAWEVCPPEELGELWLSTGTPRFFE